MVMTFRAQAVKDDALRRLLGELQRKASGVTEHDSDSAREAYLDAAVSLKGIMDKPVALADFGQDFPTAPPYGIERRLVFSHQQELDDLLVALMNARELVTAGDMPVRIGNLMDALRFGNAPAGAGHPEAPKPYTEAPDNTPDMAVTVAWPGDRGEMQSVSYGRSGGPDPDTITALDRTIVRALLLHALETLDAMP